jgi:hypothetical protein
MVGEATKDRWSAHPEPEDMVITRPGEPYPPSKSLVELSNGNSVYASDFDPPQDLDGDLVPRWNEQRMNDVLAMPVGLSPMEIHERLLKEQPQ